MPATGVGLHGEGLGQLAVLGDQLGERLRALLPVLRVHVDDERVRDPRRDADVGVRGLGPPLGDEPGIHGGVPASVPYLATDRRLAGFTRRVHLPPTTPAL